MIVKLLKPWGQWSKDHVFSNMAGGQARTLIGRGVAEEIKEEVGGDIETTAMSAPVDRMLRPKLKLNRRN